MNFGLPHLIVFNSGVIETFQKLLKLIKNPILITKAGNLKLVLMLCMSHMLFAHGFCCETSPLIALIFLGISQA